VILRTSFKFTLFIKVKIKILNGVKMEIGFPIREMICGEMYFLGKKPGG
jgi:hypothetical protein